jgi:hypothetical protein
MSAPSRIVVPPEPEWEPETTVFGDPYDRREDDFKPTQDRHRRPSSWFDRQAAVIKA